MMRTIAVMLTAGLLLAGCAETAPVGPAPIRVAEYQAMGRADRVRYQPGFVVQYNLTRVHNVELSESKRLASLRVVRYVTEKEQMPLEPASLSDLATLLRDEANAPSKLRQGILQFLLRQNYRDLAAYLIPLMGKLQDDPELRRLVLGYLERNPDGQMLENIVRSWAREGGPDNAAEDSYRKAVEQISGQSWEAALLGELNSPSFPARGEAMAVLAGRVPQPQLRRRVMALSPQTDTVAALHYYVESFDYLPTGPQELDSSVIIYKVRRDMLPDAAGLSLEWSRSFGYQFNIRDFHLLSRLARDPLRSNLKRTQLVLTLGKALKTRKHCKAQNLDGGSDSFWLQVDELTLADLWNLYLVNEMLSRPRVQTSLKYMADGDLADVRSAWGGLVFYQNGQAEAILYPPDPNAPANDEFYQPTERLLTDERDALCRFLGHFDRLENADKAGPTDRELADAAGRNYYGLVLTRVDKNTFCAHYFNPRGDIVSLGKFPLR